jgi:2-dehydro-3-deoxygalactonokinase
MDEILGCDWGTSSLRLRLADTTNLNIISEENAARGIATTFNAWKATGQYDPQQRISFYLAVINEYIQQMEKRLNRSLYNVPLVISGMASSSVGMVDVPYATLPFALDGSGAGTYYMEPNSTCKHPVLLVAGVKGEAEVMRGEETQLVGCADEIETKKDDQLFIFPGTHSKHVTISNNRATGISTFMTGEFFELLSDKSILHASVEKHEDFNEDAYQHHFSQGVKDAMTSNLLNASFRIRTNDLFGVLTKKENYSYLGGLLIGTELKELPVTNATNIYLCCSDTLAAFYKKALEILKPAAMVHILNADKAVIKGQINIFHQFKRTH